MEVEMKIAAPVLAVNSDADDALGVDDDDDLMKIISSCHHSAAVPAANQSSSRVRHSVQFMTSAGHEREQDNCRSRVESEDFMDVDGPTADGDVVDAYDLAAGGTIAMLLRKVTTTYCTGFHSPKWSDFKGVSLEWREKVRLNNVIWREWHRQFVAGRRAVLCGFTCTVDDSAHYQPQAVILEGSYWNRKYDTVAKVYNQWRAFSVVRHPFDLMLQDAENKFAIGVDTMDLDLIMELLDGCDTTCSPSAALPAALQCQDATLQKMPVEVPAAVCDHRLLSLRYIAPKAVTAVAQFPFLSELSATSQENPAPRPQRRQRLRINALDNVSIVQNVVPAKSGKRKRVRQLSNVKKLEHVAANYSQLRVECAQLDDEAALMRQNLAQLQDELSSFQTAVSTGDAVAHVAASTRYREAFDAWLGARSSESCKFALFGELVAPLFDSFMASVSVRNSEDLTDSLLDWQREYFTLGKLRQSVLSSLVALSKPKLTLAPPERFPEMLCARTQRNVSADDHYGQQRLS